MSATSVQPSHGSYLMPSFAHATVADAMHPGIVSCDPDTPLTELARVMATHHVHCIAVMAMAPDASSDELVWGIVSDFDLVKAGIADGAEPTARTIASQAVISVEPGMPIRHAAQLMLDHEVTHVVVFNPATHGPIGILSTLDIAGVLAWGEA